MIATDYDLIPINTTLESTVIAGLLLLVVCAVFPLLKYNQALRQTGSPRRKKQANKQSLLPDKEALY
ncbi:hypothetical protein FPZ44_12155 [Paenibacillus agilis]|uniref:Uncharacterized protein n=1 Tax=Paenibacillus agilis TaxID=3020863 RepID=A0A559J1M8_9BACL|nr:hypothetical protein FPZ44_12155 [Paenibacillus agilis]